MANGLPYFKWYPADAETDEFYTSLTDPERSFYHRCLNRAWINGGLPVDLEELAKAMNVSMAYLSKVWPKLSLRFIPNDCVRPRLVNPRQEEEREQATKKSQNNKRPGNANAFKTRSDSNANGAIRALGRADSGSVSDSSFEFNKETSLPKSSSPIGTALAHSRFGTSEWDVWWSLWSAKRGTASEDKAARAWISVSGGANDPDIIVACTESYLASGKCDDGHGFNPDTFLFEQARTQFKARWPAKQLPKGKSFSDSITRVIARNLQAGRDPL